MDQKGNITEHWGGEPSPVSDRDATLKLIRNMQGYRRGYTKKYLHSGRMTKPYKTECETNAICLDCGYTYKAPAVYTSAWISEDNMAQVFTNYNDQPADVTVFTDKSVKLIASDGTVISNISPDNGKITFSVDGCSVAFAEFE